MGQKTIYDYRVEPQYVDFTQRASVTALGEYVLNTAGTDAQTKGFGVDALFPINRAWVLSRIAFEFDCRPNQYEDFKVTTWIRDNNRLVSERDFEILDCNNHQIGRAVSQWCMIDFKERTPVNLSDFVEQCSEYVCDAPSPCEPPKRLRPIECDTFVEHRVSYSDIDFNTHMNTMRYITLMVDMLDLEPIRQNRKLRMDVQFLHECRHGQLLKIGCHKDNEQYFFEITTIADGVITTAVRAEIEFR